MEFSLGHSFVNRQPTPRAATFEQARDRLVNRLRTELGLFEHRSRRKGTNSIRRLSPTETVFIFRFGRFEALQGKVTCTAEEDLREGAEQLFAHIAEGKADHQLRTAYEKCLQHLAIARRGRARKRADLLSKHLGQQTSGAAT